jgi:hypothetical protein
MSDQDEITLKQAAELWRPSKDQPGWSKDGKYKAFTIEEKVPESERPFSQPGAEVTTMMLDEAVGFRCREKCVDA